MAKSFKEAFAEARKEKGAGSTFTWNGKKYSTNYAKEAKKDDDAPKSSPRAKARPEKKSDKIRGEKGEPAKKSRRSDKHPTKQEDKKELAPKSSPRAKDKRTTKRPKARSEATSRPSSPRPKTRSGYADKMYGYRKGDVTTKDLGVSNFAKRAVKAIDAGASRKPTQEGSKGVMTEAEKARKDPSYLFHRDKK